jgi:hypothetical protein
MPLKGEWAAPRGDAKQVSASADIIGIEQGTTRSTTEDESKIDDIDLRLPLLLRCE